MVWQAIRPSTRYNLHMPTSSPAKRPFAVTITLLGVLFFAALNTWRVFALWQQSSLLLALDVRPDPRIRLVFAGVWAIVFWGAALALWLRRPWSRQSVPIFLAVYALYDIILQALFVRIPQSGSVWLMRVLLYSMLVAFTVWALNRTAVKSYFTQEGTEKQA